MVPSCPLLGHVITESRRSYSRYGVDSVGDGGLSLRAHLCDRFDCPCGLVSGYDADSVRYFQHARLVSRRRADARRRSSIFDLPRRYSRCVAEHLYWTVHGAGHLFSDACGRRNSRCQIRPGLVCKLGSGLGGVRQSLRSFSDHGRVFLNYHDCTLQSARSRPRLAEGGHQMVALASDPNEGKAAALWVRQVTKHFAATNAVRVAALALDDVSLSLAVGEL